MSVLITHLHTGLYSACRIRHDRAYHPIHVYIETVVSLGVFTPESWNKGVEGKGVGLEASDITRYELFMGPGETPRRTVLCVRTGMTRALFVSNYALRLAAA